MSWKHYNPKFEFRNEGETSIFSAWVGHEYFVYDLIRFMKPQTIVELGTHNGYSFFSMCQAVKDGNLDSTLSAVDTWEGDDHAGFYDVDVLQEVKKIKNLYYKNLKVSLLRERFEVAVKDFEDSSIDLLHIDGLHTYEAVKKDFETWLPKMKDTGVILFHDVSEKSPGFGVYKLWDELKKKYKTIELVYSHGIGALFLKSAKGYEEINNEINKQYIESCMKDLQLYFGQILMKRMNAEKSIYQLKKSLKERDDWAEHLEKDIKILSQEIERLQREKLQEKKPSSVQKIKKIMKRK